MNSKALYMAFAAGLALAACGDFERGEPLPAAPADGPQTPGDDKPGDDSGNPTTDTTGPGGDEGLSFAADVHSIFISDCNTCHGPTSSTGLKLTGEAEADLATVLTLSNTGNPADSTILKKPTGQVSHGGGAVFEVDSEKYTTILQWLTDGAKP